MDCSTGPFLPNVLISMLEITLRRKCVLFTKETFRKFRTPALWRETLAYSLTDHCRSCSLPTRELRNSNQGAKGHTKLLELSKPFSASNSNYLEELPFLVIGNNEGRK